MGVSKVVLGGETLIDLTKDTVSENTLLAGETAHNAAGEEIQGGVVVVPTYFGTKEAIETAIAAGEIPDGSLVNITDDEEQSSFQQQIDKLNSILNTILNFENYITEELSVEVNTQWTELASYTPSGGNGTYLVIVQIAVPASLEENTMVTISSNSTVQYSNTSTILAKGSARRIQSVGIVNVSDTSPTIKVNAYASPGFTCTQARITCLKVK